MTEHPYAKVWRDLKRHEKVLSVVSWFSVVPELVYVPFILVAFSIFDLLHIRSLAWQISLGVLIMTLFVSVFIFYPVFTFRCPRCHNLFFFKRIYFMRSPQDKNHCAHCGLAKGALPEPETPNYVHAVKHS